MLLSSLPPRRRHAHPHTCYFVYSTLLPHGPWPSITRVHTVRYVHATYSYSNIFEAIKDSLYKFFKKFCYPNIAQGSAVLAIVFLHRGNKKEEQISIDFTFDFGEGGSYSMHAYNKYNGLPKYGAIFTITFLF